MPKYHFCIKSWNWNSNSFYLKIAYENREEFSSFHISVSLNESLSNALWSRFSKQFKFTMFTLMILYWFLVCDSLSYVLFYTFRNNSNSQCSHWWFIFDSLFVIHCTMRFFSVFRIYTSVQWSHLKFSTRFFWIYFISNVFYGFS